MRTAHADAIDAPDGPDGAAVGETRAAHAFRRLREEIVSGRLPPGAPLRFDALRRSVGVSVTPLREALSLLVSEGFVVQEDRRGFRVAPLARAELDDLAARRMELEPYALVRSIANGGVDWEARLVAAQHRLMKESERVLAEGGGLDDRWQERHRALHIALLSDCGSPWLLRFCHELYDHFDRYRRLAGGEPAPTRQIVLNKEDAIVEAALSGRGDVARRRLREHIRSAAADIRKALFSEDAR